MYTFDEFERRHQPQGFTDLVFANDLTQWLLGEYASRNNYGHILLHGPNGTAKSTTAQMIAVERMRKLGINGVRSERYHGRALIGKLDRIENSFSLLLFQTGQRDLQPYVIIDEVDGLKATDQDGLRYLMETLPVGKLIMTTNHIASVDRSIISRSDVKELLLPTPEQWLSRAQVILAAEDVTVSDEYVFGVLNSATIGGVVADARGIMRMLCSAVNRQLQTV